MIHLSCQAAWSADSEGNIKRIWDTTINEDGYHLAYKAAAISHQDGSIWLVIERRAGGKKLGPPALAVRGLDSTGRAIAEMPLESPHGLARAEFADFAVLGDASLVIVFRSGETVMMSPKSHLVLRRKDLGTGRPGFMVTRALSLSGNDLLLIGRLGSRAIIIRLNRDFDVVWEQLSDPTKVSAFVDGVVLNDDTFSLTGGVAHSRAEPSSRWVGHFNASGEVINSFPIPGQLLSLATEPGGGSAIIHGVPGLSGVDLWFRRYDRNLKELSKVLVASGLDGFHPFLLTHIPGTPGDYLIVGTHKLSFLLSRVKDGSSIAWTQTLKQQSGSTQDPNMILNVGLLAAGKSFIIPFTDSFVDSKMQLHDVVKVMSMEIGK
jgi:hypothetical protein